MAKSKSPQVIVKAPKDNNFPKLKTLTYKEMYNVIAKFIRKAVPIKGNKLTVVNGLQNRVSEPKAPYILL